MYKIVFTKQAVKDLEKLKAANISHKAKALVDIMREDPFKNHPRYEKPVGKLAVIYFRRISLQHRLVYQVYDEWVEDGNLKYQGTVKIIRMWTHYDGVN